MAGWTIRMYHLDAGSHRLLFKKQATEVTIPSASFNLNVKGVILELESWWEGEIVVVPLEE